MMTGFSLETALTDIRTRIARAARENARDQASVTLVAVSKEQPDAKIDAALAAGLRVFGENRVQEAAAHWGEKRGAFPDLRLHLIGPLQTNKVADAVALFDVIETIDRPKLADALAMAMAKTGRRPACFIQVNTGAEPQKSGVLPEDLSTLLMHCAAAGLAITGLMAVPPVDEAAGPHFALLRKLAQRHGLANLSMGMSSDFETAIGLGATYVRLGTALFGARD